MIQGCGSDVGKSVLVAGLCRLFTLRGLTVRPFKSQNMSNNAAVTVDGGEIGRAQALQARACRTAPTVDMNPVLLKPQSDVGAQLIVRGRMAGTLAASAFRSDKSALLQVAMDSFRNLERLADLVLVEGAGSPAETNLRSWDIANMGLAQALDLPVVLIGDINRGHVIAALVGAHAVLDSADRARIRGFIVNKFRGDAALFEEGMQRIVAHTGWTPLGIVPWLPAASRLPSEDGVRLEEPGEGFAVGGERRGRTRVRIAVPMLSRISNFDEFDALRAEPDIELGFIPPGRPLPADAALVILPGTKSTIADLEFVRAQGWDIDILAHVRRGGRLLGICGGYQMLGSRVSDPEGIEGPARSVAGLGLLEVETVMGPGKRLRDVAGTLAGSPFGCDKSAFAGYEMHIGVTSGPGTRRPFVEFHDGTTDGAVSVDEQVAGCSVHGLFGMTSARSALIAAIGAAPGHQDHAASVDSALDEIASALERSVDINRIEAIAHGRI